MTTQLGLIGLGTMGQGLARNIASHGYTLSLWNRTQEKITEFTQEFGTENFYAPKDFEDFIQSIERPRRIIIMVPAQGPTRAIIDQLTPLLEKDDIILDGGNAHFRDTVSYQKELEAKGIHFLGTGISGGEEGALKGPSIMPGGSEHAWNSFKEILQSIAAEDFNGKACVAHMGSGAAGHYVKMVHNGIEYAEMQALAETYDILHTLYKLPHDEIADIFENWNRGTLDSFLTEISVDVLRAKEEGKELLDLILDRSAQKGTGRWTSEEALALGIPTPSITGAVFSRALSSQLEARKELAKTQPRQEKPPKLTVSQITKHLEAALLAARILNFEQGFQLLRAADQEYQFNLNFTEITRIWQGGCVIRCELLKNISAVFSEGQKSLITKELLEPVKSLRLITQAMAQHALPSSAFAGCLNYYDAMTRERLPANFIQGLRDRFGSHTYERVDKPGKFHTNWNAQN